MTNRIIEIDSCEHCPLIERRTPTIGPDYYVCTHAVTDGYDVTDSVILGRIAPDCPLEKA